MFATSKQSLYLCDMRYFLRLRYNGSTYHGWQTQENASSVQQTLENALSLLLKQPLETVGCGRTDTGVHAEDFYAHFDFPEKIENPGEVIRRIEGMRLKGIDVLELFEVPDSLHARFSATARTYEYRIMLKRNPFLEGLAWHLHQKPNIEIMNSEAKAILGHHDFSAFSKSNTQTFTNLCSVTLADWRADEELLIFTIRADRFLRNMVRAITGTLIDVGLNKKSPGELTRVLNSGKRSEAGQSVPACGLFLTKIEYPGF